METLLSFFSDLILFTAGIIVLVAWIVILILAAIELIDVFRERKSTTLEEDQL